MPGRSFAKPKQKRNFKFTRELMECSRYVDSGELEVVASLKDIPEGKNRFYESQERKIGCLPWRLQLQKIVEKPRSSDDSTNYIMVTLSCPYKEQEHSWTVKASGKLIMEKWPEKIKGKSVEDKKSEHKENFTRKFNQGSRQHKFLKKFPVQTRHRSHQFFGLSASADSPYLRNGQFRFRLEILIHNVRKVHYPTYDFQKKTPMCNAIVKITAHDKQVYRYHVNKEYLSMHSDALQAMFTSDGFIESRTGEVELKETDPSVFNEFLNIVYPSRHRPHVKYIRPLLEFARMYFIPLVTAICEQRLLVTEDSEMPLGERLKIADQYGLFQVKSKIMQHMDCTKLDEKWTDGLSTETMQMLFRKQRHMQEMVKESADGGKAAGSSKAGEAMEVDQQAAFSPPSRQRHSHQGAAARLVAAINVINNVVRDVQDGGRAARDHAGGGGARRQMARRGR